MRFLLFVILLISISFSQAQNLNISDWKNYTDIKNTKDIIIVNDIVWAVSDGGAFSYNKSTKEFVSFTNIEGLNSISLNALELDSKNRIWFGNSNGFIDIYDLNDKSWSHLSDIYFAPSNLKKNIYSFLSKGDSVYVGTDYGVSLFDIKKNYFLDTYQKFGKFSSGTKVNAIKIFSGKIWVATASGIASASLSSKNLLSPEEWTNFDNSNDLLANNVTYFDILNNTLYASLDSGIQKFDGNKFVQTKFPHISVRKIYTSGNSLYIVSGQSVYKMDNQENYSKVGETAISDISSIKVDKDGIVWIGISNAGIAYLNSNKWEYVNLNCPGSNLFIDMAVDDDGALWCASGRSSAGKGFYSLKNGVWTNYNYKKNPIIRTDDYFCVTVGPNNTKWFGTWGSGLVQIKPDGSIKIWDDKNSNNKLSGITGSPGYVVISDLEIDNNGNLWMLNHLGITNVLVTLKSDSSWEGWNNSYNSSANYLWKLAIDQYSTKWMMANYTGAGVYYFNEKYKINETAEREKFMQLSLLVNSISADKNGEVWFGTDQGISVIANTRDPNVSTLVKPCIYTTCNISGQVVNCITIDALNNKWVGTKSSGIWVLSSDGNAVLAQFNTRNSKILDDDIKSIAIDHSKGIVYIGTEKGLSSIKTILVEPLASFPDKLTIFPNPYSPGSVELKIDGLVESSLLKILTTGGKVIREFKSPGGRIAFWDGKDNNGEYVASGIYLIVAYTTEGTKTSTGKIAVIRNK